MQWFASVRNKVFIICSCLDLDVRCVPKVGQIYPEWEHPGLFRANFSTFWLTDPTLGPYLKPLILDQLFSP